MQEKEQKWYSGMLGMTFNADEGRITIFRSTLDALGWPTHYRFLYNREKMQIAVQACSAADAGSHRVTKMNESNSCEIKCMAFSRMVYQDARWSFQRSYRLMGKSFEAQKLVSFDIREAIPIENGKMVDGAVSPTKPPCGENNSAAESSSALPIKRDSEAV